jgi:polyisoprenoid-binding protein YceI
MQSPEIITKTKWIVDPENSQVGFRAKHLMFTNVQGRFKNYGTSVYITGNDFATAEIDFWINPDSIDMGNEHKDAWLKSSDFFDVEKFKEISFTSNTLVELIRNKHYMLYGELAMKGIRRQIRLDVENGGRIRDPWGLERILFNINGKINRKDWGLGWNTVLEAGGVLISEEVCINCDVQLIRHES